MVALTHPTKHVALSIPAVRTQEKQGSAFALGQSWIVMDTSLSCDIYIMLLMCKHKRYSVLTFRFSCSKAFIFFYFIFLFDANGFA